MLWQPVIEFWFKELTPKQWWVKDEALDKTIKERFESTLIEAKLRRLAEWRYQPRGRLAEIIVLDQFSRNIYRDTPDAFAADQLAQQLTLVAIEAGDDRSLTQQERLFIYMPLMHSEDPEMHEIAIEVFTALGLEENLDYERQHKAIIDRFGRYPHRNAILGRESTPEELEFLKQPGSSF
ncbi:DUF924 family protein [Oceanospirillum sanctuarii]|uniref:DUF924 family protein n=1 Tax=Oceanospirillum sanctuarii TaxID=1434821 RepID=UPI000A3B4CC6|nr:DUF924 family protein [Oceanospirillum sanctuarii]